MRRRKSGRSVRRSGKRNRLQGNTGNTHERAWGTDLAWRYGGQTEGDVAYDGNTGNTDMSGGSVEVLREVQAAVIRLEAQLQAVVQLLEHRAVQGGRHRDTSNTENASSEHRDVQGSDKWDTGNTENVPSTVLGSMVPRVKADKAEVLARLQQMRDGGLDSTQIAMALQGEGVPTLSGKGEWHSGTVRKLLSPSKCNGPQEDHLTPQD